MKTETAYRGGALHPAAAVSQAVNDLLSLQTDWDDHDPGSFLREWLAVHSANVSQASR